MQVGIEQPPGMPALRSSRAQVAPPTYGMDLSEQTNNSVEESEEFVPEQ